MSRFRWYVARRVALMVATAWFVLSLAFVLFTIKPDPDIALVRFAAAFGGGAEAERQAVAAYRQAHNYDVPLLQRYAKWMLNYATLQWGTTLQGIPIAPLIADALEETMKYLVPSLIISTVVAHALGVYMALHRGGLIDKLGNALAYGGYGVPAFFAAEFTFGWLVHSKGMLWLIEDTASAHQGVPIPPTLDQYLLPLIILTLHLIAIQLVFIRSEVVEQLSEDFMKTFAAGGARRRDLARHALRNAAVPLLSAFFAQILTVLYLDVIAIEVAIGPSGFGQLTFNAFTDQDLGLILGVSIVPIGIGLVGNFTQDLAYTVLDPRVDYSSTGGWGVRDRIEALGMPARTQAVAGGVVVVLVVAAVGAVVGVGGLGFPGDTGIGGPATATPEPGLDVRIGSDVDWRLELYVTVNGSTEERTLNGTGTRIVELHPGASSVRASVQKLGGSDSKLTVQIVKDGEIVESASSSRSYDYLRVEASF